MAQGYTVFAGTAIRRLVERPKNHSKSKVRQGRKSPDPKLSISLAILLEDLKAKWESFGWIVNEFNGNDMAETLAALEKAKTQTGNGKPVMNLMKTAMGFGVDYMMGSHKWHGVAPNDDELAKALAQLPETVGDY